MVSQVVTLESGSCSPSLPNGERSSGFVVGEASLVAAAARAAARAIGRAVCAAPPQFRKRLLQAVLLRGDMHPALLARIGATARGLVASQLRDRSTSLGRCIGTAAGAGAGEGSATTGSMTTAGSKPRPISKTPRVLPDGCDECDDPSIGPSSSEALDAPPVRLRLHPVPGPLAPWVGASSLSIGACLTRLGIGLGPEGYGLVGEGRGSDPSQQQQQQQGQGPAASRVAQPVLDALGRTLDLLAPGSLVARDVTSALGWLRRPVWRRNLLSELNQGAGASQPNGSGAGRSRAARGSSASGAGAAGGVAGHGGVGSGSTFLGVYPLITHASLVTPTAECSAVPSLPIERAIHGLREQGGAEVRERDASGDGTVQVARALAGLPGVPLELRGAGDGDGSVEAVAARARASELHSSVCGVLGALQGGASALMPHGSPSKGSWAASGLDDECQRPALDTYQCMEQLAAEGPAHAMVAGASHGGAAGAPAAGGQSLYDKCGGSGGRLARQEQLLGGNRSRLQYVGGARGGCVGSPFASITAGSIDWSNGGTQQQQQMLGQYSGGDFHELDATPIG